MKRDKERFFEQEQRDQASKWGEPFEPIALPVSEDIPKGKKAPARKVGKGVKKARGSASR